MSRPPRKKIIDSRWMLVPIFAAPVAAGWVAYDFTAGALVALGMVFSFVEGRLWER